MKTLTTQQRRTMARNCDFSRDQITELLEALPRYKEATPAQNQLRSVLRDIQRFSHECPTCGFKGTSDEVYVHAVNRHDDDPALAGCICDFCEA